MPYSCPVCQNPPYETQNKAKLKKHIKSEHQAFYEMRYRNIGEWREAAFQRIPLPPPRVWRRYVTDNSMQVEDVDFGD